MRVAVCVTSFNRCPKTLDALQSLAISTPERMDLRIYLADADSTDGTREAVAELPLSTEVLRVTSDHYWAQGMRVAMLRAAEWFPDWFMLQNDDTQLFPDTISRLLREGAQAGADLVCGATVNAAGERTYGGLNGPVAQLTPVPIQPSPVQCRTCNGNILLMSARAFELLGPLDSVFVHGLADFDLGLRAERAGLLLVQASGAAGLCERDHAAPHFGSRLEALRSLTGPKRLPPKAWVAYCRRHGGSAWPVLAVRPYLRALLKGGG